MATAGLRRQCHLQSAKTFSRTIRAFQRGGSKYGKESRRPGVDHHPDLALLRPSSRGAPRLVSENRAGRVGPGRLGVSAPSRRWGRDGVGETGSERENDFLSADPYRGGARSGQGIGRSLRGSAARGKAGRGIVRQTDDNVEFTRWASE